MKIILLISFIISLIIFLICLFRFAYYLGKVNGIKECRDYVEKFYNSINH